MQENHGPISVPYIFVNGRGSLPLARLTFPKIGVMNTLLAVMPLIQEAGIVPSRRPIERAREPAQCAMTYIGSGEIGRAHV